MGHMLTPRYLSIQGLTSSELYTQDMRTFFAVPGVSGTNRLKIRPPADAREIEIRRKQSLGIQYTDNNYDANSQVNYGRDIYIGDSGTKMYIVCDNSPKIYQYNLSTAWDVTTASYTSKSLTISASINPRGITFNPDGDILYVSCDDVDDIYQYNLHISWDISTAIYDNKLDVSATSIGVQSVCFDSEGVTAIVSDYNTHAVYQYTCSTAWDITTASYDNVSHVFAETTQLQNVVLSSNGLKLWNINYSSHARQYSLSTAWDISTISYDGVYKDMSTVETAGANGIYIDISGNNLYMIGNSNTVYSYTVGYGAWNESDDRTSGILVGTIREYSSGTTYAENDWAIYNGEVYRSLQSSNTGNTPNESPSYWVDAGDLDNNESYIADGLSNGTKYYYQCFINNGSAWKIPTFIPDGLVHDYKLESNSYDNEGDNNGSDTDVDYVTRSEKSYAEFNGSNGTIQISPTAFPRSNSAHAYECWFKTNVTDSGLIICDEYNGFAINVYFLSGTQDIFRIRKIDTSNVTHDIDYTGCVVNTWYHLIINVNSNNTIEAFINNSSIGTIGNTSAFRANSAGFFMGSYRNSGDYFDGKIDQVRLYNSVLTSIETSNLYNASKDYYEDGYKEWEDPVSLPSSLVHYYKLNEGASDAEGTADGTAYNITYTPRGLNKCGVFNGSSSYIDLGSPSSFDRSVKTAGNGCAYECWVNTNNFSAANIIVDYNGWIGAINVETPSDIVGIKYTGTSQIVRKTGLSVNTWYHVVYNINADYKTELFIDGVSVDTDSNTTIPIDGGGNNSINIGYPTATFNGKIDQVRLYNSSLSASEVLALYQESAPYYHDHAKAVRIQEESLPTSLAHYYKLDGNANDSEGTNNGTESNVTYEAIGHLPQCAKFNGTSSYIDLGSPLTFDRTVKTAGSGCAYEGWFNFDAWSYYPRIIEDNNGWDFFIIGGDNVSNIIASLSGTGSIFSPTLNLNTWYHYVVNIKNDYSMELYLDSELVGTKSNVTTPSTLTSNIVIGNATDQARHFNGKIDGVRFYDRSLSSDEILSLYEDSAKYYKESSIALGGGLKTEYTYDSISGSILIDTANSNDGTNNNVLAVSGKIGNAGDYNGTNSYTNIDNALSGTDLNNDFSLCFWLNNYSGDEDTYISFYNTHIINFNIVATNKPYVRIQDTGSTNYIITSPTAITIGQDYFITFTRSKTDGMKLYVNGKLVGENSFSGNANTLSRQSIVGAVALTATTIANYIDTTIDQIRFLTRILTPYEIINLYNKGRGC